MSSTPSARSEPTAPAGRELPGRFRDLPGTDGPWQDARSSGGQALVLRDRIGLTIIARKAAG